MYFDDLSGKTVLVTGASAGLGAHFAKVFARHGARLVLAARRRDALEQVVAAIVAGGGAAEALTLDVSEPASIDAAMAAYGGAIDVLVNNAGITAPSPAIDMTLEDWDRVIDTNLRGAFVLAQAVARRMRDQGGGAIVNVASILGLRVAGGVASYAVSKAGLVQLTKALALEWARHGIRVNALCPGYIETDFNRDFFQSDAGRALIKRIPQRRLGTPEDLDVPLLLLSSDAGGYMSGATLVVDGGHMVSTL